MPDAEPDVAVIVAEPLDAAVTEPDASTVATEALLLDQATDAAGMSCPFWSRTSAESRVVAPSAPSSAAVPGVTVSVVATGAGGGVGSTAASPQDRTRMVSAAHAVAGTGNALTRPRDRSPYPPTRLRLDKATNGARPRSWGC